MANISTSFRQLEGKHANGMLRFSASLRIGNKWVFRNHKFHAPSVDSAFDEYRKAVNYNLLYGDDRAVVVMGKSARKEE